VKTRIGLALVVLGIAVAGCGFFPNKYEREADKITRAVMARNLGPVKGDLAPGVEKTITPALLANWADELDAQGKLQSVTENRADCVPDWHCFDVQFEKRLYQERMKIDASGKVRIWQFQVALVPPGQ
jgi:hypothetical protein